MLLILSLSGVVAGAVPPDAQPVVVDTTATFEDIDGNGIDDDCQDAAAVAVPLAVAAELLTVDVDTNGVISTTEAAHSFRIGGKNCSHGGYVSWIAHQKGECVEPTGAEPTVTQVVLVVTTPPDAKPDVKACEPEVGAAAITAAKKDKVAAAAAREASKVERALDRDARKAERNLAHQASKAERAATREASGAERQAAKAAKHAERQAAKAARR